MRKTLLKGLALLVLSFSPMLSGCPKPNLEAFNSQMESQYRESEKRERILQKDYDELKVKHDCLKEENERYLKEMSGHRREIWTRNRYEAMGGKMIADRDVNVYNLETEIVKNKLKTLKYEWALKKLGFDPYEVEKQEVDGKESPFELAKARIERDRAGFEMERMGWQRDKSYLQLEISKLQKTIYDSERAQYSTPKPKP